MASQEELYNSVQDQINRNAAKATGRPSSYTDEVGMQICIWLTEGNSLRSFCAQEGNPSYATVMRWLLEKDKPSFQENYTRAREFQAHNDGDRMNEVIIQVADGTLKPDQARVMMDGLKWTAGRRNPRVYGDKLALGGDADAGPIAVTWQQPS